MVIVAARLALEHGKRLAAVGRLEQRHVRYVHDVGVLGIDGDAAEVPVAVGESRIAPRELPRGAAVFRAVQSPSPSPARPRTDQGVDSTAPPDGKTDPAERARRKA